MEHLPEQRNEGVMRRDGRVTPFNAGDAIAAVVDVFASEGIPVLSQTKGRIGRDAKVLLEEDCLPPNIVVAAMVVAVRTRMFGSTQSIAQEMLLSTAGGSISRSQYRAELDRVAHKIQTEDSHVWQLLRAHNEREARVRERGLGEGDRG